MKSKKKKKDNHNKIFLKNEDIRMEIKRES